jgi:hypothetical protein
MRTDRRDRDLMRSHGPCAAETGPLIDIGSALDLLATAVKQRGEYYVYPPIPAGHRTCTYATSSGPQCIVGHALSLAQVSDEGLEALRGRGVRELYVQGQLPVRLTLGALAVFDAAQRTQDRGCAWGDALDHATRVALRFVNLSWIRRILARTRSRVALAYHLACARQDMRRQALAGNLVSRAVARPPPRPWRRPCCCRRCRVTERSSA